MDSCGAEVGGVHAAVDAFQAKARQLLGGVVACMEKRRRRGAGAVRKQEFTKQTAQAVMSWRVGHKVPINVYEGDRPVCQCHTAEDAGAIVQGMNVGNAACRLVEVAMSVRRDGNADELMEHLGAAMNVVCQAIGERDAVGYNTDKGAFLLVRL
jgi:hypothetical protein